MTTTIGPDRAVDAFRSENLDSPLHHLGASPTVDALARDSPLLTSPQISVRQNLPMPNPPFVFPMPRSPSSAPSSFSRATGRRSRSTVDFDEPAPGSAGDEGSRAPKPLPLPAFSFPMASLPANAAENSFLSPPQSPQSPRTMGARSVAHGHKRGGSEFVGGNVRSGDSITVMSTSPTQSESGLASPQLAPAKPTGRRGHAHRRSAAISSHDLSSIILPPPISGLPARGSSAPTSPAFLEHRTDFAFPQNLSPVEPSHSITSPKSEGDIRKASAEAAASSTLRRPQKTPNRARVGFSDTLEFIPRPLSLVSNETSSTATARPGHSLSGSISSVVSLNAAMVADTQDEIPARYTAALNNPESRPSTAGPILERTQSTHETDDVMLSPRRRSSVPSLHHLPLPGLISPATPSPTKAAKRWSFFGLEPFAGASSPTRSRPVSSNSADSQTAAATTDRHSSELLATTSADQPGGVTSDQRPVSRKRSKKQKKVKTWAGSILSRKSKARHVKAKRRTPTPPLRDPEDDDVFARPSVEMVSDSTDAPFLMVNEPESNTENEWDPSRRTTSLDEDMSQPMIDLDAALGPFNTPLPRNPEWEAAQRAGGVPTKRQLHSAAGMSRFTGPGMHYHHRRAESAPEMVPFEAVRFGMHRFNSNSTMADVFEEDEEDEEGSDINRTTGQSTPVADTPNERADESLACVAEDGSDLLPADEAVSDRGADIFLLHSGVKRKGSDLSDEEKSQGFPRMKSEHVGTSLHDEVIIEESPTRESPLLDSPSFVPNGEPSATSTPSPRHVGRTKDLLPVELSPLHLPTSGLPPISPYSMSQSSSFPSPRSPGSYDTQRISTAPSSIMTEDNFQSLLMGEPGPEVRPSVDDIPSLTSSNSTMTRESAFNSQARHPPFLEHTRPASFTSTAFGRRRSSLASLSRLISTSHGERSKLSMEVSLDSEPDRKVKTSRTKRLSRLVQFWKPKESTRT